MFFGFGRQQMKDNMLSFIPFKGTIYLFKEYIPTHNYPGLIYNFLGNIVMFIPFGFLGWIFPKMNSYKVFMLSFFSGLIIVECAQYLTRLGYFDIDDLIFNSIGASIGFLLKKKWDSANA